MSDEATTPISDEQIAAELQAALNDMPEPEPAPAAPVTPPAPAPEPISAADVAGEKAKPPTAPDSTALRDRLAALRAPAAPSAPDPKDAELTSLREAVQKLSAIQQFQATGLTPQQMLERENSPDTLAKRAIEEARQAREQAEAYRERMEALESQRQEQDIQAGLTNFVAQNQEHFPLTHKFESADLAYALMQENPELSETQAAAQVESKLADFIDRGAASRGWVRPGGESKAQESGEAVPTLNPGATGTPSTKSWADMTDDEVDNEIARQLSSALSASS